MGRRSLSWLLVLSSLSALPAQAETPTPCNTETLRVSVATLRDTVSRTDNRNRLRSIARTTANLLKLEKDTANASCLAYLTGTAYFVLSSAGPSPRADAFQAVKYLLKAQSTSPHRMSNRQPKMRLKTSWGRIGQARGWLTGRALIDIEVPQLPEGHEVVLAPPEDFRVCSECTDVFSISNAAKLSIRPGTYRVGHRSPCGTRFSSEPMAIAGPISVPKRPACPISLKVMDGYGIIPNVRLSTADGGLVPRDQVTTDSGELQARAAGYKDTTWKPTGDRREQLLQMDRCLVSVVVGTTPAGAQIEGAGIGDWGPRTVRVTHPGHATTQREVLVPKPSRCDDKQVYPVSMKLPRAVSVRALAPSGGAVTPSRLVVDGEPVELLGFHREPGQYTYAALHPNHGHVTGALTIPACITSECPPVVLDIHFAPNGPRSGDEWDTERVLVVTGSGLITGGLVMGLVALNKQEDIDTYTNKRQEGRSISGLIDARDEAAMAADGLFVLGAVTLTSALIRHWLGADE